MSIRTELTFELVDRQTPEVHATTGVHAIPISRRPTAWRGPNQEGWTLNWHSVNYASSCPLAYSWCYADLIGIGAAVTRRPLPYHRAYGSVHGGSSWLR